MPWAEISVSVSRESAALVEEALEQLGALAITLEDDADHPVLEPDPGTTPLWPSVHVRGLFESAVNRDGVISHLQEVAGADRPQNLRWRDVGDQDWERAWLDRFEPMQFGERLWIVPTGMSIPPDPRNTEIRLDPGLAFGTGTHPTTALCLQWLDGYDPAGQTLVDYGCGSGILAIAAALKGAKRVLCVDNDPQALEATLDNARRNGVSEIVETFLPDEFPKVRGHALLANILAGPLASLAPVLCGAVGSGAAIILSGILKGQEDAVVNAYRPYCSPGRLVQHEDWLRVDLERS